MIPPAFRNPPETAGRPPRRHRVRAMRAGAAVLLAAGIVSGVTGCVERSITVRTMPAHGLVYLNDVEIGHSPCTTEFEWYGDYDVRLRAKKNIGTPRDPRYAYYYLHTHRVTSRPWFQWYGVDLFAALLPVRFKDHKVWTFTLPRVGTATSDQLIQRARQLKARLEGPATKP